MPPRLAGRVDFDPKAYLGEGNLRPLDRTARLAVAATGLTLKGTWLNNKITKHPDTAQEVEGVQLPDWDGFMKLAAGCYELSGLGYIGVDMVLDQDKGPLILELNARPGLNIQIANDAGLTKRTHAVEARIAELKKKGIEETPEERVRFAQEMFGHTTRQTPSA